MSVKKAEENENKEEEGGKSGATKQKFYARKKGKK